MHRLFEAHFLPSQVSILIIASTLYISLKAFPLQDPDLVSIKWTFTATTILRAAGLLMTLTYFCFYSKYHRLCLQARIKEMENAGLAESMRENDSFSTWTWKDMLNIIWLPFVAPLYGSIPAIHAQICHFWSLDLVYVVSCKPVRSKKEE